MKTHVSTLLLISMFLSGCGATATPTATLHKNTPTLFVPQEPTSTALIVTTTSGGATGMPTEPSLTPELTATPQATATIPQVQMQVLQDGGQPPAATASGLCERPQNWVSYTVQRNDTLSSLGQRTGTDWRLIQSANCLVDTMIFSGQTLYLPFAPAPPAVTALPTIESTPKPTPSLTVASAAQGGFIIIMDDFPRNQAIALEIVFLATGETVLSTTRTADQNGYATYYYEIPEDPASGRYQVHAVSNDVSLYGEFEIGPH